MRKVIIVCLLIIVFGSILPNVNARKETSSFEYGKTYSTSTTIQVNLVGYRGDNFTINASCPSGAFAFDVMSGSSSADYINSSNDTLMDSQNMVSSVNFWFILADEQTMTMQIIPISCPFANYSITRVNASNPMEQRFQDLESNITNLTANMANLTEKVSNITIQNITNITEVYNETYFNYTNITNINETNANLTFMEENISLIQGQIQALQEAFQDNMVNNNTVDLSNRISELWDSLNGTLSNISIIRERLSGVENRSFPAAYNDTDLRERIGTLEARNTNSTNSTVYLNRTTISEKNDLGVSVLGGVIAGTSTGLIIGLWARSSRQESKSKVTPLHPK